MSKDPLLQPFQLRHLTLKNRIMTTSHEPAYAEDGMPKDRYRAYHVERARGGLAMTMTAGSAVVSRDSPPTFGNLLAWKDEIVPWLRRLADECHDHGCAVMIQITHLGRRSHWNTGDWLPLVSASDKREPAHRGFPKSAEIWDIDRIIEDYADAAERIKAAGLDGLEVQAYCHLIDQFWSDVTNDRDDCYGGTFENRMRFSDRLLRSIRDRVGDDFIVGIRQTAAQDYREGGIDEEEGLRIAAKLRDDGLVDFMNVIRGRCDTDPAMVNVIPGTGMKSAPHLDFAGKVKAMAGMPVFHAARIPDVATARYAISSGQLDMVGMTRAHMADPYIVQKIMEGREDDIRPCVGATYCLDRIYLGESALCTHNASTGRELELPHRVAPATERRRVVVVGAGVGGL
ncbi:MAG: N-methylproline demethylase, partial [Silicimonas sp.]|nr:N-methylproline demethylase [Silicimonas sp.]